MLDCGVSGSGVGNGGEDEEVEDNDDFFLVGVSIIEPPESKPVRIPIGLGSDKASGDGEIDIIEPPDEPNLGVDSSFRATIFISPPHICSLGFLEESNVSIGVVDNEEYPLEEDGVNGKLLIRRIIEFDSPQLTLDVCSCFDVKMDELLDDIGPELVE